ncbi:unnamed protein product [Paramecium sonneborni]|uniref:EGF-like domain-containing protein n=1 Tax=Paramecium sonneborni TaxID=65129 RepID=A0A8S1NAH1_9CILI|nr:unnamed protein product [Paramecium sonneborni]
MTFAQFSFIIFQVLADWKLIDYSFSEAQISNNNWKMKDSCSGSDTSFQKQTCSQNSLQYVKLTHDERYLEKSFKYRCYQVQVIFDAFFEDANDEYSYLKVQYDSNQGSQNDQELYSRVYRDDNLLQNSGRICVSDSSKFDQQTIVSTSSVSNTNDFQIKICFQPRSDNMVIGIRNMLVYVNTCYPTCLTCNGPSETQCLTCFNNQSVSGGKCQCISDQQFSEINIGCRQECDRDYSLARFDKICVYDARIKRNLSLFQNSDVPQSNQRYAPLIFIKDEFHLKNTDLVYENCNGISFIGKLQFSEGMLLQMSFEQGVKFLRIRITLYLFKFQVQSKIMILQNNQIQSIITKDQSNFQIQNLQKIFEQFDNCDDNYTLLRVEMTFQIFDSNPAILIQGQLQDETEFWGLRNFTVDTGFCQENCLVCTDFSTCEQCNTTFKLYKNKCVLSCPIHSSDCIDYEDFIPYSRYLAKGFYDLNMTYQEIIKFYDTFTESNSLSSQQKFSFLNNKIVLGGLLVWNDGFFIKSWSIQKPHYAVTVYFNLTYGDDYTGSFYYKIGSTSASYQGPFSKLSGGQNLIGRTGNEITRFFNVSLTNFQSNNLYVEFKCDVSTPNITKEFCAISEYFIVVHYCPPFCSICTSLNVCQDTGYTSSICSSNQYLEFNSLTQDYTCINCNQPGCSTCTNAEICTQCISNQFVLSNGICLCNPFTFLQGNNCVSCNKYCENCYGSSKQNCLTCVKEFHRGIQLNQCLCLPGYYDDGINLPCFPICGDQLVVEQEDCDDGNNNPFDGCHNCKFACNFACDICFNGKCYQCKSGYEVYNNDCRSICQGKELSLYQQCQTELKNCVNCQYTCSKNCINCEFGICIECDEEKGWYIQFDGTCNSICGDGIVTSLTEMCDDGNTNPSDGCNYCQYSCDLFCQVCVNSLCISCQNGYQLIQNKCIPNCQDGNLVFPEQCEDGNIVPYDGCFNCQFQCSNNCIDCQFGICYKCNELNGWYLQEDRSCKSVCGDNILVLECEECDNNNVDSFCDQCQLVCDQNCQQCQRGLCLVCIQGYKWEYITQQCVIMQQDNICFVGNNQSYDGCYESKLNCQQSCTLCSLDGCLECNTIGWQLDQQQKECKTVCGDGIIVLNYEECDDLIDENCFSCKKKCQNSCLFCQNGDCMGCKKGWVLFIDKRCYPISGDSYIVGNEQCDDNNQIMFDGCYLSQNQCQISCIICEFGKCIQCNNGYYNLNGKCQEILNDGQIMGNEQCDDMNLLAQDGCFHGQYDCPEYCEHCHQGQCLKCSKISSQLDNLTNQCLSFCGDGYLANQEQCDDENNIPYDGCYECKFQCNQFCQICENGICFECQLGYSLNKLKNICDSVCGNGIITHNEECDNGDLQLLNECSNCKLQCQEQCIICVNGQCLECIQDGWQLNLIDMNCQPICGDQIVLGNEQCDDGNDKENDGCANCFFKCQDECTKCEFGECRECGYDGWELIVNECFPICGDYLVLGNEECDDGNMIRSDGCFECKYLCQDQCTDCVGGYCKACNTRGWELNKNNVCVTVCGDGIVINLNEQCDDGNDIPFDGCYLCEFQCEQLCTLCEQGICYECNQLGWIIKDNQCTPYCGDGLIIGNEQCDDMNSIANDGCYECKFMCDQYCIECEDGICKECPIGMHLFGLFCQSKCGDGYHLQMFEQCDDGNNENGDGCNSQCVIEQDWVCISYLNTFSLCSFEKRPDFSLIDLKSNPDGVLNIQIAFNQKVKFSPHIRNNLSEYIQTRIIGLEYQDYNIYMTTEVIISYDQVSQLNLQFGVTFLKSIEHPIFQIKFLNDSILSEFNQTLIKNEDTIKLQTPLILTSSQVLIAQQTQKFNQAVIISLGSISTICLLTGQQEIFWNLMDQLQYLSYIKYINIQFSPNLNIFFDVFQLITVSPLISALGFQKFFDALDGNGNFTIETTNKFLLDDINAYFLLNFESFLFCLITTYMSYFSAKIAYYFLNKIQQNQIDWIGFKFGKIIISFRKKLKIQIKEFYYNAILRLLLSNSYDICFACAIQVWYYPKDNNNIYILINYYFSFILFLMNISTIFSKQTSLRNRSKYQEIFEGINNSNKTWTIQYNSVQMIKKLIFISFIVFLQDNGLIQTLIISFFQSLFFIHIILNRPLNNYNEYVKIIFTESLIIFNLISFILYYYRIELELTSENLINLGWLHIATFSLIFIATFLIDITQQIKKLIKLFQNARNKQESLEPIFY